MTLSFSSSPGNLFNRIGKLGLLVKNIRTHQLAQYPAMTDPTLGVVAQFVTEPDLQALMGNAYIGILGGVEGAASFAQSLAIQTINRQVFRDLPRSSQTLQSINTLGSIQYVIQQMKNAGATILAMTITAAPIVVGDPGPHFNGIGNGVINASVKRPLDGLVLENSFGETVLFTCSADSYTGGATIGNEAFQVVGQGNQSDVFAFNWPLGSGANIGLNAIDGNTSNGSGNLLTNSGFELWTLLANQPDQWIVDVGTPGVQVFQEVNLNYDGSSSLRILGDGTTNTRLYQQFNSSTGTQGTLTPLAQYSFNVWARRDGTVPGAGVMTIELVDQNGNVISDANGVANTFNIALTGLTTSYASFTGVFRTPVVLPTSQFIRMRLSTPLTNNRSVYFDKASMGIMSQIGTNNPFYAVHAGSIPFQANDYGNVLVSNSRGAGGTISTMQSLMYQLFTDGQQNEILYPSSATPTISDNLIG